MRKEGSYTYSFSLDTLLDEFFSIKLFQTVGWDHSINNNIVSPDQSYPICHTELQRDHYQSIIMSPLNENQNQVNNEILSATSNCFTIAINLELNDEYNSLPSYNQCM